MKTLTLQQAAALLLIHPITLQERARIGEIPAAKPGKRWVFVEDDLLAYLRAQYPRRALQGDYMEKISCHSSSAVTHPFGGSNSLSMDVEYSKALGLPTKRKRGNSTTN